MFIVKINGERYSCNDFFQIMRTLEEKGWILASPPGGIEFVLNDDNFKQYGKLFYSSNEEGISKDISELPSNPDKS